MSNTLLNQFSLLNIQTVVQSMYTCTVNSRASLNILETEGQKTENTHTAVSIEYVPNLNGKLGSFGYASYGANKFFEKIILTCKGFVKKFTHILLFTKDFSISTKENMRLAYLFSPKYFLKLI